MKYVVLCAHKYNITLNPYLCSFNKNKEPVFLSLTNSVKKQAVFYDIFTAKKLIKIAQQNDSKNTYRKNEWNYYLVPQNKFK